MAPTLLELLSAGRIDEFNARRGQRVTLDFFAADLAGLSLAGIDLSGANLEKADLTGADLTGAILAKANLSGADLTGAKMDRVVAVRARMREAFLGDASLVGAELSGVDLGEADLTGAVLTEARLVGARLKEAVLVGARLNGADLSEARLHDADLRNADLTGATLTNAEMIKVNAGGARFEGAKLEGARLGGAVLKGARLARAVLTNADLSGADLTGADLNGANLDRADLFDVTADADSLKGARLPAGAEGAPVAAAAVDDAELHFDDPSVAISGEVCGVLWENAEADDSVTLRFLISTSASPVRTGAAALAVPVDQILARGLLPTGDGFSIILFLERPAGVELMVLPTNRAGVVGAQKSVRLGYTPVVKPVLVPDDEGFLLFGIGRQGALSVHRFDGTTLHERMRAPANTYRGFCGRLDPVLLGKGGTVAAVAPDGIGRLLSAPTTYPGRLTTAAATDDGVALAWAGKGEKGFRFQRLGVDTEAVRVDAASEIGALDLRAFGDKWLAVYTREASTEAGVTAPMAVWLPGGKPFALLGEDDLVDIEDVRLLPGPRPVVGLVTFGEDLLVVDVGTDGGKVRARLGELAFGS